VRPDTPDVAWGEIDAHREHGEAENAAG
jgi:hypothetical protein